MNCRTAHHPAVDNLLVATPSCTLPIKHLTLAQ